MQLVPSATGNRHQTPEPHASRCVRRLNVVVVPPTDELGSGRTADRCVDVKVLGGAALIRHQFLGLRHRRGAAWSGRGKRCAEDLVLVVYEKNRCLLECIWNKVSSFLPTCQEPDNVRLAGGSAGTKRDNECHGTAHAGFNGSRKDGQRWIFLRALRSGLCRPLIVVARCGLHRDLVGS